MGERGNKKIWTCVLVALLVGTGIVTVIPNTMIVKGDLADFSYLQTQTRASLSSIEPNTIVFSDSFESYITDSFPSTWTQDANAYDISTNYIDGSVAHSGNKSLRLFGQIGASWGALAYHPLGTNSSYQIVVSLRNGNEALSGAHPDRAYVGLRQGTSWTNPSRMLLYYYGNGTVTSGSGAILGTYSTLTWYNWTISYERISSSQVRISYTLDGISKLTETLPAVPSEDQLTNLDLTAEEGTVWFDDVMILSDIPETTPGGINVALQSNGGIATASSSGSYMGYSATSEKANDGLETTFWAGTSAPDWYQVQFNNLYSIDKIVVYTYYHTQTYYVELSSDGSNWAKVVNSFTTPDTQPSGTDDSYKKTFTITPTNARYIKVTITSTDAPGSHIYQTALYELEAYSALNIENCAIKLTSGLNIEAKSSYNLIDDYGINDHIAPFSWSQDCSEIVFSADDGSGFYEIHTINLGTCDTSKMTNSGKHHFSPSWHLGGSWILFNRMDGSFGGGQNGNNIYKLKNDGTGLQQLTTGQCEAEPLFSPTGNLITFMSAQDNRNGWYHLWTMSPEGENEILIGNHGTGGNPVFSPNGEYIAYEQRGYWDMPSKIYVIKSDGTNDILLYSSSLGSQTTYDWSALSWSPDGSKLLFTDGKQNSRDIYSINRDGTDLRKLTNNNVEDYFRTAGSEQVWNPVTNRIVYVSYASGSSEIWTMNPDGGGKEQVTNDGLQKTSPLWSPDGSTIAYLAKSDGKWELYGILSGENEDYVDIDTGFNPLEDGFSFPNYGGSIVPGRCFGISEVATLIYNEEMDVQDFNPSASNTYQLKRNDGDLEWKLLAHQIRFKNYWNTKDVPNADISEEFTELKTILESGEPAIILSCDIAETAKHAVVVYSMSTSDDINYQLSIYDPNQPGKMHTAEIIPSIGKFQMDMVFVDGQTLEDFMTSFVAVRASLIFGMLSSDMLWIKAECPVELSVFDSTGTKVGETLSDGETHLAYVLNPTNQDYRVELTGTGDGAYNLTIARSKDNQITYQNTTGTIKSDESVKYSVAVSDTGISLTETTAGGDTFFTQYWWIFVVLIVVAVAVIAGVFLRKKPRTP